MVHCRRWTSSNSWSSSKKRFALLTLREMCPFPSEVKAPTSFVNTWVRGSRWMRTLSTCTRWAISCLQRSITGGIAASNSRESSPARSKPSLSSPSTRCVQSTTKCPCIVSLKSSMQWTRAASCAKSLTSATNSLQERTNPSLSSQSTDSSKRSPLMDRSFSGLAKLNLLSSSFWKILTKSTWTTWTCVCESWSSLASLRWLSLQTVNLRSVRSHLDSSKTCSRALMMISVHLRSAPSSSLCRLLLRSLRSTPETMSCKLQITFINASTTSSAIWL